MVEPLRGHGRRQRCRCVDMAPTTGPLSNGPLSRLLLVPEWSFFGRGDKNSSSVCLPFGPFLCWVVATSVSPDCSERGRDRSQRRETLLRCRPLTKESWERPGSSTTWPTSSHPGLGPILRPDTSSFGDRCLVKTVLTTWRGHGIKGVDTLVLIIFMDGEDHQNILFILSWTSHIWESIKSTTLILGTVYRLWVIRTH